MTTVVGVRFREVGKIYYFDPGELELKAGDSVIVDTVRGTEFGTVMIGNRKVEDEEIVQPLKVVRRRATEDDVERVRANREKEKNAFIVCKQKVKERGMEMKLISAEYTFDNAKILFYFTADGRVDFRELVKDLAAIFRIRIELRQVGVRDETKLMGGLGGCGRPLCCASYLSDFVPVSIRMAKEQNLSLNPQKISGVCGRLMCCLKNEADTYEDLNTRLPKDGGKVITPDGREGIAETVNVLRERVRVLFTDEQGNREMEEFPASALQFTPRRKPKPCECRAAKAEDAYDYDASELVAEADSETDPAIKALMRAEAEDVLEERDTDEADANMVGDKKRRRRRKRKPSRDQGDGNNTENNLDSNSGNNSDNNSGGSHRQENTDGSGHRSRPHKDNAAGGEHRGHEASDDIRSASGDMGDASDGAEGRSDRPRRRRRRHHQNGENAGAGEGSTGSGSNGNGGDGDSAGNSGDRNHSGNGGNEGSRNNGNRNGSRNGSRGNGSGNNAQKQNDSVKPQQSGAQSDGQQSGGQQSDGQQSQNTDSEGKEKKHNGAYRRFRKRRPKDTAES